jgi:glycosyltransferase involved in cell wall biosynthesis
LKAAGAQMCTNRVWQGEYGMRIGIDMLGVQEPLARGRGIGRYSESLVDALLAAAGGHEFVLYFYEGLPGKDDFRRAVCREMTRPGGASLAAVVQTLVDQNPDQLDAFLVTNPFSFHGGYILPSKPFSGMRTAAVLYDLIPYMEYESYLGRRRNEREIYHERLARLKQYDALLAISDATKCDGERLLGRRSGDISNISSATRTDFFRPPERAEVPERLRSIGIDPPFVFSVGGMDRRKNCDGLIRAFAALPEALRSTHLLAIACQITGEIAARWQTLADELGVGDRLRILGAVSDDVLRECYQHCAAFAFASYGEGFGLPILEAMACGAPVVAGDNSSQPEVVGDAGLLANAADPLDLADKLACLLTSKRTDVKQKSVEQARRFSWAKTAARAQQALIGSPQDGAKPLVALFAPFPPLSSPVADFAESLAETLAYDCTLHLYHEPGHTPALAMRRCEIAAFDQRLFVRQRQSARYDAVVRVDDGAATFTSGLPVRPGSIESAAAAVRRELAARLEASRRC